MREINSDALTKDSDKANCLVLTPVNLIEEEMVSVKWIRPVKIQTTIRGSINKFILSRNYITDTQLGKTPLPQFAAVALAARLFPALVTGPGQFQGSFQFLA
jgi:hypothetical protein